MGFFKNIDLSSGFKRILSNTGYLFGEKVFNMVISLVVGIWVARYLGPDDFGLWQYANSLVGLVTIIASLGTTQVVVRDLVDQSREKEGRILGTTFILMLGAGSITVFAVISIGFWLNDESLARYLIVICSASLVLQAFNTFDYWFQSKVLSKYSVYARTSARFITSVLKILFIVLSLSVIYFALTIIIAGIVRAVFWIYNYEKKGQKIRSWEFDLDYSKNLLKDTWPLIISGVSVAIYMKIDQVMLKTMVDSNAVGNYAVAVRLSETWYFIPMTISSSVFPSIIQSKKESIEKYHRRMQYLYDVLAGLAIAIAIPMTFLSDSIINLLYGSEYELAGEVLAIYIWAGVFVFLGVARSRWIINENYQHYGMIFNIIGALINIGLNIWMIPVLGIVGAAWATIISQALSAWFLAVFFKKTRIAFRMHSKSIINALLIIPTINSLKQILKEAQN